MPIITPTQAARLKDPPKPPPAEVRLITPDGRPTKELADWLNAQWQWNRRLFAILKE